MNPETTIAIYGSHDASVTFIDYHGDLRIYEYERFANKRYAMFSSMFDNKHPLGTDSNLRNNFLNLIKNNLKNKDIKNILYLELNESDLSLLQSFFPNAEFTKCNHHFSHASCGFYSSGFNDCIIFSVDGGGNDNNQIYKTKIYLGSNNQLTDIPFDDVDFGNPYSGIGYLISEIKPDIEGYEAKHALSYSGKIMGLCAYGKVRDEWVQSMTNYYKTNNLENLCKQIGIPCTPKCLSGKDSYDLAATSQYVFEKNMSSMILPFVEKYNKNVILVGGCALNVLYNQKLYEILNNKKLSIYIPPNPNDCGLSYGMFVSKFLNYSKINVYSGIELLDNIDESFYKKYDHEILDYSKLVDYLKEGKIIGLVNLNSEIGPRALGNRSIICDPSFENMKDILNKKVKFREWYRPFAPVCRLEDKDLYFLNCKDSQYMSYAPKVKDKFKAKLKSIVHEDDTTRLQTVTNEQHSMFYNILTEMNNKNYLPVILNTSFNIKGQPILTKISDAFYVLDNTELDCIVYDNKIFKKKNKI